MRFHLPGIAHTITNKDFVNCAYTQKIYKLCAMLTKLGHEVYHYGCEGSNPICTENVKILDNELRLQYYPTNQREKQWEFNTQDLCYQTFNRNAIREIEKRMGGDDFLLCSWGWGNKPIADAIESKNASMIVVEPGIGYKDTFAKFRVFESYTWMSWVYGKTDNSTGRFYDCVIPNYFDPNDFTFSEYKEDWFLYLGRLIETKGLEIILQTIAGIKGHVKLAGQGDYEIHDSYTKSGATIEKVGFADVHKRRELLSKAKAVFVPTIYIEPFGGVSIESLLSGSPVISTDWGVFGETILHGITGYRCRTLDQFQWAARNVHRISPRVCREYAITNFSMDRVALMFQEYFEMLSDLRKSGWPEPRPNRTQMDWLTRYYPSDSAQHNESRSSSSNNIKTDVLSQPTSSVVDKYKPNVDLNLIMPLENEPLFALDLRWFKAPKKPGISFMIRARNEEKTIGIAIDSIAQLKIPFEINVFLNRCTDNTRQEVERRRSYGIPIKVYDYPFNLAKAGLEHWTCPPNSVHSMVWYTNWCMMKGNYDYTFRWDADFEMTSQLRERINALIFGDDANMLPTAYAIPTQNNEMLNLEKYLFSNELQPSFRKLWLWETLELSPNIPHRYAMIDTPIIHVSSSATVKEYWKDDFWWNCTEHPEAHMEHNKSKELYHKCVNLTGTENRTGARACDPDFGQFLKLRRTYLDNIPEVNFFERIHGFERAIDLRPLISVNIPSRGRPQQLMKYLNSLAETVHTPSFVEVLIRCDDDDPTADQIKLEGYPFKCTMIKGPRNNGYLSCNDFHNELAAISMGEIFWLGNDDLECKTKNWDLIMLNEFYKWPDGIVCLFPDHSTHDNNCFAAITKTWFKATGHISLGPFSDAWVSSIAKAIGREVKVPIYLEHALVHNPSDKTYVEGSLHPNTNISRTQHGLFSIATDDPRNYDVQNLKDAIKKYQENKVYREY